MLRNFPLPEYIPAAVCATIIITRKTYVTDKETILQTAANATCYQDVYQTAGKNIEIA